MLLHLPLELLIATLSELNRQDLKHVSEVSKGLYAVAAPFLYRSITLPVNEDLFVTVSRFLQANQRFNLLHNTTDIQILSPFHWRLKDRCLHSDYEAEDEDDGLSDMDDDDDVDEDNLVHAELQGGQAWIADEEDMEQRLCRFINRIMSVLIQCKEDHLRAFSWQVGHCIPEQILGPSGYLCLKQKHLESVHLVTDGSCQWGPSYNLKSFSNLTTLSWAGLRYGDEFQALRECLEVTSHQLIRLELDLLDWGTVCDYNGEDEEVNFWDILNCPEERLSFQALQQLSLSGVSFTSVERKTASIFNFRFLRSLKLRFCPGWEELLSHIRSSHLCIRLQTLDIQSNVEYDHADDEASTISAFLEVIEGLQELFISTSSPFDSLRVWRSMLRHENTLRKFVHHQRNIDYYNEKPCDLPDLSFRMPDDLATLEDLSQNPFSGLDLEFIGLCCRPLYLRPIITPLTEKNSLAVLHIRQSGSDLKHFRSWGVRRGPDYAANASTDSESSDDASIDDESIDNLSIDSESIDESTEGIFPEITEELDVFAQWAFGGNGFQSLRVLALGDFSYNGRYSRGNVLLCRSAIGGISTKNYRYLNKGDSSEWKLLHKYSHILQACPTDLLLRD